MRSTFAQQTHKISRVFQQLPPHFHAEYGEFEALYVIETLEVLRGNLPRRAHSMVVEWALAHRAELRANWIKAREQPPLEDVEPLD